MLDTDHCYCSACPFLHVTYSHLATRGLLLAAGIKSHSNEDLPENCCLSQAQKVLALPSPPLEGVKQEAAYGKHQSYRVFHYRKAVVLK